ncbi:hypothetical protein D477_010281 [Arthrobacter crystallopoietes BAB-32]|uniref:HNH nuclease domain-containing protein n=2 Tax=Crystallibacter crystallopoietes TaxID=37928 RepID=N1UVB8_9MICC|nr:hypothetical protein D477_010281 [Arthrobacter crystallopoietes BAB-32]
MLTEGGDDADGLDGAALVDRLRALEDLKAAAAARQAADAVALDRFRRESEARKGVPADKQGRGVGREVALARRESPRKGGRLLGLANALVKEMPHTMAALKTGQLNEWRATILVRETACLTVEDRAAVDEIVAGNPSALEGVGDRKLAETAKRAAYARDPHALVARASKAAEDRHVSCRPAPDTMACLTALLPVRSGVAVNAALSGEADRLRAAGDQRSRGQIMADTLVERVTGRAAASPADIEIQLVMTDRTLLQGSSEPAYLSGYGTVPAQYARNLLRPTGPTDIRDSGTGGVVNSDGALAAASADPGAAETAVPDAVKVAIRRLYTAPVTGQLVGMDSRARIMPEGLRRFIRARDAVCRTPWCDAPIRHFDHVIAYADGGLTTAGNGQGLCEACNLAMETPGWSQRPVEAERHTVETTTPTGHTYYSTAPELPGTKHNRRLRPYSKQTPAIGEVSTHEELYPRIPRLELPRAAAWEQHQAGLVQQAWTMAAADIGRLPWRALNVRAR